MLFGFPVCGKKNQIAFKVDLFLNVRFLVK